MKGFARAAFTLLALSSGGLVGCVVTPYYGDAIPCELQAESIVEPLAIYRTPAYFGPVPPALPPTGIVLVYLDLWERLVTIVEDPALQQAALGGPDTVARTLAIARCANSRMPLPACPWCN